LLLRTSDLNSALYVKFILNDQKQSGCTVFEVSAV